MAVLPALPVCSQAVLQEAAATLVCPWGGPCCEQGGCSMAFCPLLPTEGGQEAGEGARCEELAALVKSPESNVCAGQDKGCRTSSCSEGLSAHA